MKILLLGGPRFLGYALIEAALAGGHEITLFNRGKTNPGLFPGVERLVGNRDGNLDALRGRKWDVVLDTCGYLPRIVRQSVNILRKQVEHYTFISSISVYPEPAPAGLDETAPVGTLPDPTVEEITGETYGPLKALCEQEVETKMPGRTLTIRPGLIVGPNDPSDRFTYWPARVARGGEVLAPGEPGMTTQVIDVRDLADWIIRMAERRKTGVYNATGPRFSLTMADVLYTCKRVSKSDAFFTWVSEEFLLENEVGPFVEMPLWVPKAEQGLMNVNIQKALADGLTFRPLAQTIADTLAWQQTRPADYSWRAGLAQEKEQMLLTLWHQRQHDQQES